jgi:hypothetical protein
VRGSGEDKTVPEFDALASDTLTGLASSLARRSVNFLARRFFPKHIKRPLHSVRAQFRNVAVPIFPVDLDDLVLAILFAIAAGQELHNQPVIGGHLIELLAFDQDRFAVMEHQLSHTVARIFECAVLEDLAATRRSY